MGGQTAEPCVTEGKEVSSGCEDRNSDMRKAEKRSPLECDSRMILSSCLRAIIRGVRKLESDTCTGVRLRSRIDYTQVHESV